MAEAGITIAPSRLELRRAETLARMDANDETIRVARAEKIADAIDASETSERISTADFFARQGETEA